MAFHFEKPEGFAYKAGQFGDYTLISPSEIDAEGNTRGFSLASAPYEDDLMFATRMRDTAFKRVDRHAPFVSALICWTMVAARAYPPARLYSGFPLRQKCSQCNSM